MRSRRTPRERKRSTFSLLLERVKARWPTMEDADARRVAARLRSVLEPPEVIVAELADRRVYTYVSSVGPGFFERFHVPVTSVTSGIRAVAAELRLFEDDDESAARRVSDAADVRSA